MGRLLGYIFVLGILYFIFSFVFSELWIFLAFTRDFLFHTRWGVMAVICLVCVFIFGYASKKTHEDVKIRDEIMKSLKNSFVDMGSQLKLIGNSNKDNKKTKFGSVHMGNEIDLSNTNLRGVLMGLAKTINKPTPIFFKGWSNRRLKLDVERVLIIKDYIEAIIATGQSFVHLQADAILSYEKIEKLVQIERNNLLRQLKQSQLDIDLVVEEHRHKVAQMHLNIRDLEAIMYDKLAHIDRVVAETNEIYRNMDLREKETASRLKVQEEESTSRIKLQEQESLAFIEREKLKTEAEVKVMMIKAKDDSAIAQQRAKILDKVIAEMNINNISPSCAFVLINMVEPGTTAEYNFRARADMAEQELERFKAENAKKWAEANEQETKSDFEKWKNDKRKGLI